MSAGIWEYDVKTIHDILQETVENELDGQRAEFSELVVFGSYGRGKATDESDLDLLIVLSLTEELTDAERRDLFTGIATAIDQKSYSFPAPITEVDALVCRVLHRDAVLADCLEETPQSELENSPCLVYSLTKQEQRSVLHP